MAAPVVQSVNDIVNELKPSIQAQSDLYDQQIADNDTYGKAQVAGIEAKKTKAFGQIEQQAQNKGMYFSGFSPEEQAGYTSDTYLPALASLQKSINDTRTSILGQKNSLMTDIFNKAYDTNQTQQGRMFDYNQQQDSFAFQASESEKERSFQAQQAAADRAAQAAVASVKASSSGSSSNAPTKQELTTSMGQDLQSLFANFGNQSKGYTEKVILPQLTNAYPELSPGDISKAVYSYRKNVYGS